MKHLTLTYGGLLAIMMFFSISLKAQITLEIYGSSNVYAGQASNTYYSMWRNNGAYTSAPTPIAYYSWHVQNGTTSSPSSSGITVNWTAIGPTTMVYDYATPTNYYQATLTVNVSTVVPYSPNTSFTTYRNCSNTVITRTASPPANETWYWQTTPNGTSTALGSGSSITINSPTPLYLSARNSLGNWGSGRFVGNVTILSAPPPAPAIAYDRDVISSSSVNVLLGVSDVSGATTYQWFTTSTGGVPDPFGSTNGRTWYLSGTTTFHVASVFDGCPGTARKAVTAYFHPGPMISATDNGVTTLGSDVTLSLNYAYDQYQWKRVGVDLPGATSATYTTSYPGIYTVSVKKGNSTAVTSPAFTMANNYTSNRPNLNYIISETIQKAGLTNVNNIGQYTIEQNQQITQYFDGLGRPVQSVVTQGSPLKRDIIQPTAYDNYGREPVKYLPYISTENTGFFNTTFTEKDESGYSLSPQYKFYNNGSTTIAQDQAPYVESILEANPLSRVIKQGSAGTVWQPDGVNTYASADHTIKFDYTNHVTDEIIKWTYVSAGAEEFGTLSPSTSAVYYGTSQLGRTKTKDEEGHEVIEFKDKQGKVLLRKVQADGGTWAQTYYIYDDFDNLICVIQPEGVSRLSAEYFNTNAAGRKTFLKRWSFRYAYDGRKRATIKQVPGVGRVYMVYDNRDRVVLTQDSVQRLNNQWMFTKYDRLNRPVLTGIYNHGTSVSRLTMSDLIHPSSFTEVYDKTKSHGYTTNLFPTASLTVHTATYYDNYAFQQDMAGTGYQFDDGHLDGQEENINSAVFGQVTGSRVNILNTNDYLWSVIYYDEKYRVIQAVAQNHFNGTDRVTNIYDFTGKALQTKTTHGTDSEDHNITRTFTYDHGGRLIDTYHKIDNEDPVLIVRNEYNELGQLLTKKLHGGRDAGVAEFVEEVDYQYNIRGWLTGINDPAGASTSLFSFQLKYDNPISNGGDPQFNGNISETIWKTAGSSHASYGYFYDAMNRMKESKYNSAGKNNRFNESILNGTNPGYDLNGNILYLQRTGKTGDGVYGSMDNLTYTYTGNQVTRVDDAIATAVGQEGFKELIKTDNEYTYDGNGNMIADKNKGIILIAYNHLNLPTLVKKSETEYIVYTYDAAGVKLKQQVYGSEQKTTVYAGEYIYENDTLRFINHEEGRILPDASPSTPYAWEYQYHLTDHLGNVRVTFSEHKSTTPYEATMEKVPSSIETAENAEFQNMNSAKKVAFYNHTAGAGKSYSYRLSGSSGEVVGPAKSLEVNGGDMVDLEVYARYTSVTTTNSSVSTLLPALISAFGLSPSGGPALTGENAYNSFNTIFSGGPFIGPGDYEDALAPKAYLNYILFGEDFIPVDFGFNQVSAAAGTAHEFLTLSVKVTQKGFLYIYLSNENDKVVDVFFDDLKVTHHTGVEQSDDYYAFGLQFNSYQRENSMQQNYLFNGGSELERGLDLGWYHTLFRDYDPATGRFIQIDPMADFMPGINPYHFAYDNPVMYSDPDGLAPMWWLQLRANVKQAVYNVTGRGNQHAIIHGRNHGKPVEIGAKTQGRRPDPNPRQETTASNKPEQKNDPEDNRPKIPEPPKPTEDDDDKPKIPRINNQDVPPGASVSITKRIDFIGGEDNLADPNKASSQLDPLVQLLLQNPEIKAYIQGNVGDGVSPDSPVQLNGNLVPVNTLMSARARAIYNFLKRKGVPAVQLHYGPGKINQGAHYDLTITVTNGKKP